MKRIAFLLFLFFGFVAISGCSEESPSLRVQNDRTEKANVQFKPQVGSTFNINNVEGGVTTNYQTISEGTYEVKASIQAEKDTADGAFNAENDYNYTVIIKNVTPPALEIKAEKK